MNKRKRFSLMMSQEERNALIEISKQEGQISAAAVIRKLINQYLKSIEKSTVNSKES